MLLDLLLPLLLPLSLPYEREAIPAAPSAVGGARRRCDASVWATGAIWQMGYVVVSYLVRVVHKIQVNLSSYSLQRPLRTGANSERIRLFFHPLGTESEHKEDFLSHNRLF